jgi:hypothetical protein
MKGLNCPYCNKDVIKFWKVFLLPPLFLLNQTCMHCYNPVKFNWRAFWDAIVAIAVAALLGMLIDKIYSFDSILFDVALYGFAACVPSIRSATISQRRIVAKELGPAHGPKRRAWQVGTCRGVTLTSALAQDRNGVMTNEIRHDDGRRNYCCFPSNLSRSSFQKYY